MERGGGWAGLWFGRIGVGLLLSEFFKELGQVDAFPSEDEVFRGAFFVIGPGDESADFEVDEAFGVGFQVVFE